MSDIPLLVLCLVIPMVVGAINGGVTAKAVRDWYPTLDKPSWTPPNWLFAPVWTVLYLMMGTALWLVWRQGLSTPGVPLALAAFGVQMTLNAAWSPVFFGMRSPTKALPVLLVMDVAVVATIVLFAPLSGVAAALLVPYLGWGLFATVLNVDIVRRNPEGAGGAA